MSNTVLLVDDDVHILRAAEFKLKRSGYRVSCAFDGEQAWEQIGASLPDVVVTDVQMPRLDGIGLVRRIRQTPATSQLPVIMLTAKGLELTREKIIGELGVFDVVSKPFSPRELVERVRLALAGAASPEGALASRE